MFTTVLNGYSIIGAMRTGMMEDCYVILGEDQRRTDGYVVAAHTPGTTYWDSGHYFETLAEARGYFITRITPQV